MSTKVKLDFATISAVLKRISQPPIDRVRGIVPASLLARHLLTGLDLPFGGTTLLVANAHFSANPTHGAACSHIDSQRLRRRRYPFPQYCRVRPLTLER